MLRRDDFAAIANAKLGVFTPMPEWFLMMWPVLSKWFFAAFSYDASDVTLFKPNVV